MIVFKDDNSSGGSGSGGFIFLVSRVNNANYCFLSVST